MTILVIDESWTKIDPAKAKADGYSGMIGYLSNDPSKNITAAIAAAWHALGMSVGVVWETTARRSAQGPVAGAADVNLAERLAVAMGVPRTVGIYYATDFDASPKRSTICASACSAVVLRRDRAGRHLRLGLLRRSAHRGRDDRVAGPVRLADLSMVLRDQPQGQPLSGSGPHLAAHRRELGRL